MNQEPDRTPVESAPDEAIIRLDQDATIVALNDNVQELIGTKPSVLLGKSLEEAVRDTPALTCLAPLCEPVRRGHTVLNQPLQSGDSDKTTPFFLTASLIPIPGDKEGTAGMLIRLERTRLSPATANDILGSLADGVFTVDRSWKITSFNRAAESITGWPAREALGRSCSEVFQASICGRSCAMAESLYSGKPVYNRSFTINGYNGEKIPVSICAAPLVDRHGNIIGGVKSFRDLSALTTLRKQLSKKYSFDEIVSKSKAMQRLFAILPEVAASPSTVLIYGESGTGKELMARSIFNISDRHDRPFVALNCAALPESLLEAELFGYKAGAFTDARRDKGGRFAAAEGGTLFLDEIGDLPGSIQVKLLRVLQEKTYEPLGSNKPVKADVRIITATNRDLQKLVLEDKFREDLYYRLNVVRIHLPPLRERKEDIPLLIKQFIEEYCAQQGKEIAGIASPALNILMRHDFPGNVRELKNIIEYAFILCQGGYILPEHLPEPFNPSNTPLCSEADTTDGSPLTLEEIEKQAIFLCLKKNGWRRQVACDELGISRDTLRRKLAKYGLEGPEGDES